MCDSQNSGPDECQCKVERVPNFAVPRLLIELAKNTTYGYELIERLGQDGIAAPDPGNLYRMLRSLEEEGCVSSSWDTQNSGPARRVYTLTDHGHEFLKAWAVTIRQTQLSLNRFLSDYENLFPE
jgi:PadR family transcriptional regulator PadR